MHDQSWAGHLAGGLADVDAAELLEEPHRVFRGGGAPLQLIECGPVGAGSVGLKLRGEDLTERRVVTPPADPGQLEIQCRSALFLVADGPHRAATRIRATQ